jgi:hypothetical protein
MIERGGRCVQHAGGGGGLGTESAGRPERQEDSNHERREREPLSEPDGDARPCAPPRDSSGRRVRERAILQRDRMRQQHVSKLRSEAIRS